MDHLVRFTIGPGTTAGVLVKSIAHETEAGTSIRLETLDGDPIPDETLAEDLTRGRFCIRLNNGHFTVLQPPFAGGAYGVPGIDNNSELRTIMQKVRPCLWRRFDLRLLH